MLIEDLRGRLISKQLASTQIESSICYLDRLIRDGKIKAVRLSPKMTRIDGDSLADFLEQQAAIPSTPRGKAALNQKGAA
jgi:hypothetical protein